MSPARWARVLETAADRVIDGCVDLDPEPGPARHRTGDGRSVWIEPTASQYTSSTILAEEEHVLTWAMGRQADQPAPSDTVGDRRARCRAGRRRSRCRRVGTRSS